MFSRRSWLSCLLFRSQQALEDKNSAEPKQKLPSEALFNVISPQVASEGGSPVSVVPQVCFVGLAYARTRFVCLIVVCRKCRCSRIGTTSATKQWNTCRWRFSVRTSVVCASFPSPMLMSRSRYPRVSVLSSVSPLLCSVRVATFGSWCCRPMLFVAQQTLVSWRKLSTRARSATDRSACCLLLSSCFNEHTPQLERQLKIEVFHHESDMQPEVLLGQCVLTLKEVGLFAVFCFCMFFLLSLFSADPALWRKAASARSPQQEVRSLCMWSLGSHLDVQAARGWFHSLRPLRRLGQHNSGIALRLPVLALNSLYRRQSFTLSHLVSSKATRPASFASAQRYTLSCMHA